MNPEHISVRRQAEIKTELRGILCRKDDTKIDILWHYTTGDRLIKILMDGELWLTQIGSLNDASELKYPRELYLKALEDLERGSKPDELTEVTQSLLRGAQKRMQRALVDGQGYSSRFVGSLSERGNWLSQWRGYGGGEGGFSIGFDRTALQKALKDNDPDPSDASYTSLSPICYDKKRHASAVEYAAKMTCELFKCADLRLIDGFLDLWHDVLGEIAPLIKDPAFDEEREWRLMRLVNYDTCDRLGLAFSNSQSMLKRHFKLQLKVDGLLPIKQIMVGPARHQQVSVHSLHALLLHKGYKVADPRTSAEPGNVQVPTDADAIILSLSKIPYQST